MEQNQDNNCENVYSEFQNYRRDGTLCDVTIVIEKGKFPVHKVLLSATSFYFKILFTGEMKEKVQDEISIKGVTEPAISICLKFIYREKFDIKMDEVGDLLHAACLFQLKTLKQRCMVMIQSNINVSNCVQIYKLSQAYECEDIEMKSKTMLLKNAEKLFQDDKVISNLDADTLKMMVKSEDLSVSDESVIFEALLKWIAVDEEERKDYFCEMLEFIRLPVMDKDYFIDVIWNNNHIQNECQKCKKYFADSAKYDMKNRKGDLKDYQLKKRMCVEESAQNKSDDEEVEDETTNETVEVEEEPAACHQSEFIVVSNWPSSINKFDVENNSFSDYIPKEQIPMKVGPQLYCLHNGILYLFGARNSDRLFRYEDGKWNGLPQLTNMYDNMSEAHLTSYKDFLLVIGNEDTKAVYCFNVTENKWMKFASLNEEHGYSSSAIYRDCVYVMGGWKNFSSSSSSVERFDSSTNKWQMMPRMNQARYRHASAVYQDKIFVAGGHDVYVRFNGLTSVETFHEGDNTWTFMQSLNVERVCLSLFVNDNILYAFGGLRKNGSSLYETFDEESNSWKKSNEQNDRIKECKVFVK